MIIQHSKLARIIAIVFLIIWLIFWIGSYLNFFSPVIVWRSDSVITHILALMFVVPVAKYIYSFVVHKVLIDERDQAIIFGRSFGTTRLQNKDILRWGIRKIEYNLMQSFFYKYHRFFEAKLKNGDVFIYPLDEFGRAKYNGTEQLQDPLEKILNMKASQLQIIKGFGFNFLSDIKYILSIFYI